MTQKRLTAGFSLEINKSRMHWDDIFKVLTEKRLSTKNFIPNKTILQIQRKNTFLDKQNLNLSSTNLTYKFYLSESSS